MYIALATVILEAFMKFEPELVADIQSFSNKADPTDAERQDLMNRIAAALTSIGDVPTVDQL